MDVPNTLEEYIKWAKMVLGSDFKNPKTKLIYDTNVNRSLNAISEHRFFKGLQMEMEKWGQEYSTSIKSVLLMDNAPPKLVQKPYLSAVNKSYRVNVLWNRSFPNQPEHGWVTADNLYSYFNDLIRCSVVCKFIDGPIFLTRRLMTYAHELGLEGRHYSQERDEGYYAYHFYVNLPVMLMDKEWQENSAIIVTEIQMTTQLQEVLRNLTHDFYETSRVSVNEDSSKWKWEFRSNRFRVGYLSHTLHLLESIIVESRDKLYGIRTPSDGDGENNS